MDRNSDNLKKRRPCLQLTTYGTLKAGLAKLTQLTAADGVKNTGVRCNAIAPGVINTPMTAPIYFDEDAFMAPMAAAVANVAPVGGGVIDVQDVAGTVLFLASDEGTVLQQYYQRYTHSRTVTKKCNSPGIL